MSLDHTYSNQVMATQGREDGGVFDLQPSGCPVPLPPVVPVHKVSPIAAGAALCRQALRHFQSPVFPAQQASDAVTPHRHHVEGVHSIRAESCTGSG